MACKPPPYWVSIIFIVVGVVIAVLAVLPWFLIPDAIEKEVIASAIVDSKDHENFDDFSDPPDNPLRFQCYFWNITNPIEVMGGAVPSLESVGPYMYKRYQHRFNITFLDDGNEVEYQEWGTYYFYPNESFSDADPANDLLWSINPAYLTGVVSSGFSESQISFLGAQENVFTEVKDGLTNVAKGFAVNVLNTAWPTVFNSYFTAVGSDVPTFFGFFDGDPGAVPNPALPTIVGTNGTTGINVTDFGKLLTPGNSGSFFDPTPAGVTSWLPTNAANKIASLTQSPYFLTPSQATAIFTYRTINPFKAPTDLGGPFYGAVLQGVTALKGISGFSFVTPATWLTVLPNFGYRHFGRYLDNNTDEFGIIQIGTASLSVINLDAATAEKLFNNIPEISLWARDNFEDSATVEFGSVQPSTGEMTFFTAPQDFTQTESQWILDTFSHEDGSVAIGVYLSLIPGVLAQIDAQTGNGLYSNRNLTIISAVAWNTTAVTISFAGLVLQNNNNSFPFDPLPAFNFRKAFTLYLYLKYNILGSIIRSGFLALNGGPLFTTTPEQWLFGRNDTFLSELTGTTVAVPGVWSDFNEVLALEEPLDRYTTGKEDPRKARFQLTYEGETGLERFYSPFDPPVKGSSLTFIGPYRLRSKTGEKKVNEDFLLWVPNVVRELQLIYSEEVTFKGITLFRYIANANYESVVESEEWINPYDFVMNCKNKYTDGFYDFYLTFPGWTLVKETNLFNDLVEGVEQDEDNLILFWDFEPITGIAMNARAPLQLSLPVGMGALWDSGSDTYTFDFLGTNYPPAHIPAWYIVRSNSISDKQADEWKSKIGGALSLQLGLTIALPVLGFLFVLTGVILLIWRAVGGKGEDMQEFELRT